MEIIIFHSLICLFFTDIVNYVFSCGKSAQEGVNWVLLDTVDSLLKCLLPSFAVLITRVLLYAEQL